MFWLCVAAMTILALFITLFTSRPQGSGEDEVVLAVYKQQLDDLESDATSGALNKEQAPIAKLELEHTLLKELEGSSVKGGQIASESAAPRDWLTNGFIMVLLPVLAIALYYKLGQPQLGTGVIKPETMAATDASHEELRSIEELVVGLEERLQQAPEDEKGWFMLTRTYMAMNRFHDALESVEHLYKLSGDQAEVLLIYANVLMLNNEESFAGKPIEMIQQALELEPNSVTGLWLAGLAALEQADHEAAITYWQKLLPLVAADEQASQQVKQMLAQVYDYRDIGGRVMPGAITEEEYTGESVAGESVDNSVAATATANDIVVVNVSLSAELFAQTGPDDVLFVFARADDGIPMPLAASRLRVADLPATVVLNDTQAMMPSRKLSAFKEVQVVARISKSGNAIAKSGDLSSGLKLVRVGDDEPVVLVIDQLVP
jgi:cytochrome c-type biogenesis protein CcmH